MSRCFRFPPPGYEKKDTLADTDLLAKEKHKEKKHKKDKKDKKDKESKERKKDKEGGERKHKDKTDRKEKHKEKKDRDKEKKRTLGAEDGLGQSEGLKGEASCSNGLKNGGSSDSKFVLELGKRIRDDDGARENDKKSKREDGRSINGQNTNIEHGVIDGSKDRDSEKKTKSMHKEITNEKEEKMKGKEHNKEETMLRGSCKIYKNGQSAILLDHPKEVNKSSTNGILGKRKEHEVNGFLHDNGASPMKMPRPTSSSKSVRNGRKLDTCQTLVQGALEKHLGSNRKVEDTVYDQVPQNGRKVGSNCGLGERASEGLKSDNHHMKESKVNGQADMLNISARKSPHAAVQIKVKTEVSPKVNDFLSGQQLKSQPSKPPPVPLLKEKVEVSKKLEKVNGLSEARQSNKFSSQPSSSVQLKHEVLSFAKFSLSDSKMINEEKVNGHERPKPLQACSSKPPVHPEPSKAKVVISQKVPHRDLKYLNKILSVPTMAEWSDFDDQEWLFCSGNLSMRKTEVGARRCDETQNVWAKAFRIDSADVIALPYVIPF